MGLSAYPFAALRTIGNTMERISPKIQTPEGTPYRRFSPLNEPRDSLSGPIFYALLQACTKALDGCRRSGFVALPGTIQRRTKKSKISCFDHRDQGFRSVDLVVLPGSEDGEASLPVRRLFLASLQHPGLLPRLRRNDALVDATPHRRPCRPAAGPPPQRPPSRCSPFRRRLARTRRGPSPTEPPRRGRPERA